MDIAREENREILEEFIELVDSAQAHILEIIHARRDIPDAKTFIGSGKVEEIRLLVESTEADLVIINQALSPAQERNLTNILGCRVVDRVGLILDIFAQRARTHEGKLQVELAQLKHMSTRLVRGWTHLEKQRGGIGMRGPGETQLETDKRLIADKIKQVKAQLDKVLSQRQLSRRARVKNQIPVVAIVGYTNAGKSSLFNRLTGAEVYAENRLFATLDATLRRVEIPGAGPCILVDTVGFIRHIPHDLVASFRSTLEEAREADLLIHLVDCADELQEEKMLEVVKVLKEIEADQVPVMTVMNKIDRAGLAGRLDINPLDQSQRCWVSAQTGEGMALLMQSIASHFQGAFCDIEVRLLPEQGKERASLFELGEVLSEQFNEQGESCLRLRVSAQAKSQLMARHDIQVHG